jgi:hypothetical protein
MTRSQHAYEWPARGPAAYEWPARGGADSEAVALLLSL